MLARHAVHRLLRRSPTRACSSSSVKQADDAYCFELVKTHDYESFISGLLVPQQHRGIYFALRAFNVEIATIKDQIPRNNVNAGRIRFQFWKDCLHQLYEGNGLNPSINQPVARALQHHMAHRDLKLRWFERMIESR
jgi:NADH dehydrogenase [ubiquinone] 1 alpha subcomplex assembly factor 6